MQRKIGMVLVLLILLLLVGCRKSETSSPAGGIAIAQGGLNNAILLGTYGYSFSGFDDGGRFVVAVGHLILDGKGEVGGSGLVFCRILPDLGCFLAIRDTSSQAWHDKIAGTGSCRGNDWPGNLKS